MVVSYKNTDEWIFVSCYLKHDMNTLIYSGTNIRLVSIKSTENLKKHANEIILSIPAQMIESLL